MQRLVFANSVRALAALSLAAMAAAAGAMAWAGPSASKPCCELWILESATEHDSYALKSRHTGRIYAVAPTETGAFQLTEGDAAKAVMRRWSAMSRLADSTSVLLDARESRINFGVDAPEPTDAPDDDGRTLIIVRNVTPEQMRRFITEMPHLTPAARAHLANAVPAR